MTDNYYSAECNSRAIPRLSACLLPAFAQLFLPNDKTTEQNFAKVYCSAHIEEILFRVAWSCVQKAVQRLITDVQLDAELPSSLIES